MPLILTYGAWCLFAGCLLQWIPPHERARAVSLTTSGAWQQQVQCACSAYQQQQQQQQQELRLLAGLVSQQPTELQHQQPAPPMPGHVDTPLSISPHTSSCLHASCHKTGMYLGSAAAMLVLPSVAAAAGPASLLRLVGALGLSWLLLWLVVGREIPHR
jgi:hypothetical protein